MKNAASDVIYVVYILDFINSQLKSDSTYFTTNNTYSLLEILIVIYNLTWLKVLMHSLQTRVAKERKSKLKGPGLFRFC